MISALLWLSSCLLLSCHGAQVQYAAYSQQPQQQFQEYSQVPPHVQYYSLRSDDALLPTEVRNPPKTYTEQEQQSLLKQAMKSAWEQYGPTSTLRMRPEAQTTWSLGNSTLHHRDTAVEAPAPDTFQSTESEWDKHINPRIPPPRVPLEPTWFSRFLNQYLDFEVNHYDVAEFIRRALVVVLVGLAIFVWIGLGAALGFLPGKMLSYLGVDRKRDLTSRGDDGGNDLMSDITDRVYLALDGDWLTKLEERVLGSDSGNWLTTHVKCCILPDAKTNGMADCQLMRRQKRDGTFKCLTDFIYSFQFGPQSMKKPESPTSTNKANKTDSH